MATQNICLEYPAVRYFVPIQCAFPTKDIYSYFFFKLGYDAVRLHTFFNPNMVFE